MACRLIKVGNTYNMPMKQYVFDTKEEMDAKPGMFGDRALIPNVGTFIMGSNSWIAFNADQSSGSSSGSSGSCTSCNLAFEQNSDMFSVLADLDLLRYLAYQKTETENSV